MIDSPIQGKLLYTVDAHKKKAKANNAFNWRFDINADSVFLNQNKNS